MLTVFHLPPHCPLQEIKAEKPEQPDPSSIEVVSVTEEDLPTIETPNTVNVSPLGSFNADPQSENTLVRPEDSQPPPASSPTMPVTKVQPFLQGKMLM